MRMVRLSLTEKRKTDMNKLMMAFAVGAAILSMTGCKSISVDRRGFDVARDAQGNIVCTNGVPVIIDLGWEFSYWQHWQLVKFDDMSAGIRPGEITVSIGGYYSAADSNLVALVNVSLQGAAELAAKIGTAIATCGGSAAAEGGAAAIVSLAKTAYEKFKAKGGNEAKAVVTSAADGTVTVTDGTVGVQCKDGECSYCEDGTCAK